MQKNSFARLFSRARRGRLEDRPLHVQQAFLTEAGGDRSRLDRRLGLAELSRPFAPPTSMCLDSKYLDVKISTNEKPRDTKDGRRRFGHAPVARVDEGASDASAPGEPEHRVVGRGPL
jgi:hypothetical protein